MDFIIAIPKLEGKNVVIVVVYRLTKSAHFYEISHPFSSSTLVVAFINIVHKLHGKLNIIVSDRDPIFTRKFWTELFSCLGA
jgi:hypothetical protein